MKQSIWILFIVTAIALSSGFAAPASADEVTGYIDKIFPLDSRIEVVDGDGALFVIHGFPFNNLEAQLEVIFGEGFTIKPDDCLSVQYYEKTMPATGETFLKWDSLSMYINESNRCEDCPIIEKEYVCDCTDIFCSDDKDSMTIEPFITQNRAKPGVGQQGYGQGQVHGKPPVKPPGHDR